MRASILIGMAVLCAGRVIVNCAAASDPPLHKTRATLILVQGAAGTDEYERMFDESSMQWRESADAGDVDVRIMQRTDDSLQRDELQRIILDVTDDSDRPLWLVLIGHGTFDGRVAKFNLEGPDVSATELAEWLEPVQRPLAIIHGGAASSPFIDRLSGKGRVIVTATKSGSEVNFARFGGYIATAINDLGADLDKDGQVSLLEAFLTASRRTAAHYEGLGLLATEHALLDDTGDARGVSADFFEGLRPVKAAEGGEQLDGHVANQWHLVPSEEERRFPNELRPQRDEIELRIAHLRDRKAELEQDIYYASLEVLLVELAKVYERADEAIPQNGQVADEADADSTDDLPPDEAREDDPQ